MNMTRRTFLKGMLGSMVTAGLVANGLLVPAVYAHIERIPEVDLTPRSNGVREHYCYIDLDDENGQHVGKYGVDNFFIETLREMIYDEPVREWGDQAQVSGAVTQIMHIGLIELYDEIPYRIAKCPSIGFIINVWGFYAGGRGVIKSFSVHGSPFSGQIDYELAIVAEQITLK